MHPNCTHVRPIPASIVIFMPRHAPLAGRPVHVPREQVRVLFPRRRGSVDTTNVAAQRPVDRTTRSPRGASNLPSPVGGLSLLPVKYGLTTAPSPLFRGHGPFRHEAPLREVVVNPCGRRSTLVYYDLRLFVRRTRRGGAVLIVAAWTAVGVVALRVEHLWASAWWVEARVERWVKRLEKMGKKAVRDPLQVAEAFQRTDGAKLPWLFFGVKSHRLWLAIRWARSGNFRRILAPPFIVLRALWVFYIFAPVTASIVASLALTGRSVEIRTQLLVAMTLLSVGSLALVSEASASYHLTKRWRTLYHRWPKPIRLKPTSRGVLQEQRFFIGAFFLTVFPCAVSTYLLAGVAYQAYPDFPNDTVGRLTSSLTSAFGLTALATPSSLTTAGWIASTSWLLVALGLIFVGFRRLP